MIGTLAVIGVGLIGGSFSLALKDAGVVKHVIGAGRGEENLKLAQELGIVDSWTTDLAEAVRDADVVMIAVPMGGYARVMQTIAPALKEGAIVTDGGSTKQHALEMAKAYLPENVHMVAAHPLAGTEKSGAAAAFKDLYQKHLCIVTPEEETSEPAKQVVIDLWQATGAKVLEMPAAEHDVLLASVSHLPHLAAFALVNAVNGQKRDGYDPFAFAAGGFRDFTRIASSSPVMWRDIALANRGAMIAQIDAFKYELDAMKQALLSDDGEELLQQFTSAKEARDAWLASKEEVNKS